ncbi:MAG TPA: response regulator [Blastocatellia bacterium]
MNVLVADGDATSREHLVMMLEDLGHWVLGHRDGKMAREIYKAARFALVIADSETPGLSGLDLCRGIREINRDPRSWVIITGRGTDPLSEADALPAGADAYMAKPIRKEDLRLRLAGILGSGRAVGATEHSRAKNVGRSSDGG